MLLNGKWVLSHTCLSLSPSLALCVRVCVFLFVYSWLMLLPYRKVTRLRKQNNTDARRLFMNEVHFETDCKQQKVWKWDGFAVSFTLLYLFICLLSGCCVHRSFCKNETECVCDKARWARVKKITQYTGWQNIPTCAWACASLSLSIRCAVEYIDVYSRKCMFFFLWQFQDAVTRPHHRWMLFPFCFRLFWLCTLAHRIIQGTFEIFVCVCFVSAFLPSTLRLLCLRFFHLKSRHFVYI